MKISIIADDRAIVVDGSAAINVSNFSDLGIHPLVHAVQYDTESERGEVEYKQLPGMPQIPNQVIGLDQFKAVFGKAQDLHREIRERAVKADDDARIQRESEAAMEEAEREAAARKAADEAAAAVKAAMTPDEKLAAIQVQADEIKALADAMLAQAIEAHRLQAEKDAAELAAYSDKQMKG